MSAIADETEEEEDDEPPLKYNKFIMPGKNLSSLSRKIYLPLACSITRLNNVLLNQPGGTMLDNIVDNV